MTRALVCLLLGVALTSATLSSRAGIVPLSPRAAIPVTAVPDAATLRDDWVVTWATRLSVDTALALAVAYAENPGGRRDVWSRTGCCVGVMQVNVREHLGEHDTTCGGSDLLTVRDNACYGVAILRDKLTACAGDVTCAVHRYSGYYDPRTRGTPGYRRYVATIAAHCDGCGL